MKKQEFENILTELYVKDKHYTEWVIERLAMLCKQCSSIENLKERSETVLTDVLDFYDGHW